MKYVVEPKNVAELAFCNGCKTRCRKTVVCKTSRSCGCANSGNLR